jgi:outer membrane protein
MVNLRLFPIAALLFFSSAYGAVGLKESFESALKNNQTDNINQSRINQNYELKKQYEGNYLPSIAGRGTYQKVDNVNSSTALGLNLSHSLYKGGQDYYEVQSAKTSIKIAENQKEIDRIALYENVIMTYYDYVSTLNDMDNLNLLKKLSRERDTEIRKRVQIGRSRKGEQMQAEAQVAAIDADILNGEGLLKQSRERFYILTGLDRNTEIDYKAEAQKTVEAASFDEYLSKALARQDVKNRQLNIELSERALDFSKAFHMPVLDVVSNYYLSKSGGTVSSRESDWDIGLVLTIPLFEGGTTQARVRESSERRQQAIYELSDYEKAVKLDVSSKYETFNRYNSQLKAYDIALTKGQSSYNETVRDYRLGLGSNLDAFTSLNLYLSSKRNAERTKIQALMTHKLLEASAGVLP